LRLSRLVELGLEPLCAQAIGDGLDQAAQLAVDLIQLAPLEAQVDLPLAAEAIHLAVESAMNSLTSSGAMSRSLNPSRIRASRTGRRAAEALGIYDPTITKHILPDS
jgi:hypothetical protein